MKKEQSIVERIHALYRREFKRKKTLLMKADLAIRYYRGEQDLMFNSSRRNLIELLSPYTIKDIKNQCYANIFAAEVDAVVALMTNKNPKYLCNPTSSSYEDIQTAELNERLLSYKGDTYAEKSIAHRTVLACALTGTAYREEGWDDTTKSAYIERPKTRTVQVEVKNAETGEVVLDENNMAIMQEVTENVRDDNGDIVTEFVDIGDVGSTLYNIFEVFTDDLAAADPASKGAWLLTATVRKIEWVKQTYGNLEGIQNLDKIEPISDVDWKDVLSFLRVLKGLAIGGEDDIEDDREDMCVLYRYFEPASKEYPKGRMVMLTGDNKIYDGDNINIEKYGEWHMLTQWNWNLDPVANISKPLSADLEAPQRRLNEIDNLIQYYIRTSAAPQREVGKMAGLKKDVFTGTPMQNYMVNQVGHIQTLQAGTLSQDVFLTRKDIIGEMSRLSSSMEAYRMQRTGRLTAFEYQASTDAGYAKVAPILLGYENFLAETARKRLKVIKRHYTQNRNDILQGMKAYFKGDKTIDGLMELTGDCVGSSFNISIEAGSTLPESRAAQQDKIVTLASSGLLGDITNPLVKNSILHKLQLDDFAVDVEPDVKRAHMENSMYSQGKQPERNPTDNDAIHIAIHTEDIKSPGWYDLPDETRKLKLAHLKQHTDAQAQAQQQQMAQQVQMMTAIEQIKAKSLMDSTKLKVQADLAKEQAYFDYMKKADEDKHLMAMATIQQQTDGAIAHEVIKAEHNTKSGGQ